MCVSGHIGIPTLLVYRDPFHSPRAEVVKVSIVLQPLTAKWLHI